MIVIYKENTTKEITWKDLILAIKAEQQSDVECPRWDIVEQGETLSFTGCYAEALGYKEAYFGFVPNREKMDEEDGMLVLDFIWQSYDEFDIKMYQDAHLKLQEFIIEKFPNSQQVIQITTHPTEFDWTKPVTKD